MGHLSLERVTPRFLWHPEKVHCRRDGLGGLKQRGHVLPLPCPGEQAMRAPPSGPGVLVLFEFNQLRRLSTLRVSSLLVGSVCRRVDYRAPCCRHRAVK